MRVSMLLSTVALIAVGCAYHPKGYRLNRATGQVDAGPTREQVFEATKQVLLERYPEAAVLEKSDLVLALSPIELLGGTKSRKQVTAHIRQTYTGAWEPRVRVVLHAEVHEPYLDTDPEAPTPVGANPVAIHDWTPLQFLPSEALEVRNAILAKVDGLAGEVEEVEDLEIEGDV